MKRSLSYILLSLCAAFASVLPSCADGRDSVILRNSDYVSAEDVWLTGSNAAALTRFRRDNLSWAELHYNYAKGGFVNYNGSTMEMNLGADVRSFYRLSPSAVVYGRISYDYSDLHNMTGSVFIAPERYPFNIVEDSLTNPGTIHMDTYHLTGGVGVDLWRGYALGAKVDFTAANAAKYKDLRHKNKLMNIDATAGFYLPIVNWLSLGIGYHYSRHSESLSFSTYGKTDAPYMSLIEYGGMIGMTEQFGTDGMTGRNFEQPLFYDGHGYFAQAELRLARDLTWYNHWGMSYLKGYYGKDTPYNIVYMRHGTHRYNWTTRLSLKTAQSLHTLDASISNEKLSNRQNQYRLTTNEKNVRHYEYFQPLKTADKVRVDTHIGYTGYINMRGETHTWQLSAGTNMAYRKQTAYLYPYYRRQKWTSTEGYLRGERNIFLRKGVLALGLGVSYKKGSGDIYTDGTFIAPSDKQTNPAEMTAFLHREYAYLVEPQYALSAMAKYSFIMPSTHLKSYVRADYAYRHSNSNDEWLQGTMHWTLGATVGINF